MAKKRREWDWNPAGTIQFTDPTDVPYVGKVLPDATRTRRRAPRSPYPAPPTRPIGMPTAAGKQKGRRLRAGINPRKDETPHGGWRS